MAGHGGAQADLGGLLIAHFADQDNVRILAQDGAQHARECQLDFGIHLNLIDTGKTVFNRIFNRNNLVDRLVEFLEGAIQRCGFAAAGRTGHQHHAVRVIDQPAHAHQQFRRQVELLQVEYAGGLVEQTHHGRLAVLHRQRGKTHIDALVAHPHVEAAVLRHTFFGNVETGHELETRNQRRSDLAFGGGLHAQHAVLAEADAQFFLVRLDVDVGGIHLDGVLEHGLQELHHRRIGQPLGRCQRPEIDVVGRHFLFEFLGQARDLGGAPVHDVDGLEQIGLAHHGQLDRPAQHARQLVVGKDVSRIGHADEQGVACVFERQHPESACVNLGNEAHHLGFDLVTLELDVGYVELTRQKIEQLVFREISAFDQTRLSCGRFFPGRRARC
jgi:hypothetical protein